MGEPKQVIVIRRDLNMPPGKLAAQVAHASMGALLHGSYNDLIPKPDPYGPEMSRIIPLSAPLKLWLDGPFVKICLGVDTLDEMIDLKDKAEQAGLKYVLIKDAARTIFDQPTITCLGIGPNYGSIINEITGHLKLY
jgi:peptidyl-tRNA hydrolase